MKTRQLRKKQNKKNKKKRTFNKAAFIAAALRNSISCISSYSFNSLQSVVVSVNDCVLFYNVCVCVMYASVRSYTLPL